MFLESLTNSEKKIIWAKREAKKNGKLNGMSNILQIWYLSKSTAEKTAFHLNAQTILNKRMEHDIIKTHVKTKPN